MMPTIPLSLYIHLPWCVQKCPYCDFNSHALKSGLPEDVYVNALLDDLRYHQERIIGRQLTSIFFGGGTPSLFSGEAIATILNAVSTVCSLPNDIEITLEANPGTVDEKRFSDFYAAGVNRLSLGVQSLQQEKLHALGRIHNHHDAHRAIKAARQAGFKNLNIDIMYGLPNQTIQDALSDIHAALLHEPTHFSWYQLTIEPNTAFHHTPPKLPNHDTLYDMQQAGQDAIAKHGFLQYEVSAYSLPNQQCVHNKNYWEFGDYLGIGAGAHSKLTDFIRGGVVRFIQVKHPKDYMQVEKRRSLQYQPINNKDLIFEFMLNAMRLTDGVSIALFEERTQLVLSDLTPIIDQAIQKQLLSVTATHMKPTPLGALFLNDLVSLFL